ncbi:cytochrome P450 [Lipomyces kononenkoae]|uniref:Cytochrome P450 n=1 Tax=Lipomyces kononenkoae TaxID=34357 RepID=A0ACC3SQH2_LIPKO
MLVTVIGLLAAVAILAKVGHIIYIYLLDPYGLRKFPSVGFSGITSLWSMYHNYRSKRFYAIHKAHEKLGPVVRVQPHHLSFSTPDAFYDIYSHSATRIIKDEFYDSITGEFHATGDARSREEHSRKRRTVAHAFSMRGVVEYEPAIMKASADLIDQLDKRTIDKGVSSFNDVDRWIHLFTFDAIADVLFSNSFRFLKLGDDLCVAETKDGKQYLVHAIETFFASARFSNVLGYLGNAYAKFLKKYVLFWTYGVKMGNNYDGMSIYRINCRTNSSDFNPNDIMSRLLAVGSKPGENQLQFGEVVAECNSLVNAGNSTIGAALTNIVFHLAKNPNIQDHLQQLLDECMDEEVVVPTHEMVKDCQYLRACIDESLRDKPPVSIGLPRLVPPEGATIAGYFVPGNTTVSAATWTIHHDPQLFPEPFKYRPERWLDEKEGPIARKYCLPFSTGGRACVGRNLAYLEMDIVVATLFHRYKVELAVPGFELESFEWFNSKPGPLPIKLRRRTYA